MNKEESLALYAKGKDAWNRWAEKMLAERKALEEAGRWRVGDDPTDEASAWNNAARADFSQHTFEEIVDFNDTTFPSNALFLAVTFSGNAFFNNATFSGDAAFHETTFQGTAWFGAVIFSGSTAFRNATFSGNAWFSRAKFSGPATFSTTTFSEKASFDIATFSGWAKFSNAIFSGDASFSQATFSGNTAFGKTTFSSSATFDTTVFSGPLSFNTATFSGDALFLEVTFSSYVWFDKATFSNHVSFNQAAFLGDASFNQATFLGDASFNHSTFSDDVSFQEATFSDNASFKTATFSGDTSFRSSVFEKLTIFAALKSESAFSLANTTFLDVPDFIQAHFHEAPRLDNIKIIPKRKWSWRWDSFKSYWKGDSYLAAKWRELKRLALQGHNPSLGRGFFKGESNAQPWGWDAVALFGHIYLVLSNFGQSLVLPLLWWVGSSLSFAIYYLGKHRTLVANSETGFGWMVQHYLPFTRETPIACINGPGDPWSAALGLSLHKALPILGQGSEEKLHHIYACLYGAYFDAKEFVPSGSLPGTFTPIIPDGIAFAGTIQTVFSTALIFLFVVANGKHFRLK